MLLGPIFGAAADRWSRKRCAIVADVLRVVAFAGIALVDSFEATVALAVLAGAGTGLFTPAGAGRAAERARRHAPDARRRRRSTASSRTSASPSGRRWPPPCCVLGGPETLIWVNAATFALSGLVLVVRALRRGAGASARRGAAVAVRGGARRPAGHGGHAGDPHRAVRLLRRAVLRGPVQHRRALLRDGRHRNHRGGLRRARRVLRRRLRRRLAGGVEGRRGAAAEAPTACSGCSSSASGSWPPG